MINRTKNTNPKTQKTQNKKQKTKNKKTKTKSLQIPKTRKKKKRKKKKEERKEEWSPVSHTLYSGLITNTHLYSPQVKNKPTHAPHLTAKRVQHCCPPQRTAYNKICAQRISNLPTALRPVP